MPFDIKSNYSTDKSKETEGVVISLGSDAWIKLARMGGENKKFAKIHAEGTKAYKAVGIEHMPPSELEEVLIKCFAEAVVLNWEGIEFGGEPIEFSVENCKKVLKDAPEFMRWISEEATKISNFQSKVEADEAKN